MYAINLAKNTYFFLKNEKNFLKAKKHSILSALKTRRNKDLKGEVSFYLLYLFFFKIFLFLI